LSENQVLPKGYGDAEPTPSLKPLGSLPGSSRRFPATAATDLLGPAMPGASRQGATGNLYASYVYGSKTYIQGSPAW
jgi:hypothetical protein